MHVSALFALEVLRTEAPRLGTDMENDPSMQFMLGNMSTAILPWHRALRKVTPFGEAGRALVQTNRALAHGLGSSVEGAAECVSREQMVKRVHRQSGPQKRVGRPRPEGDPRIPDSVRPRDCGASGEDL